ncbi:hypothetical protein EP7_002283 [Isosphaeraceae bacterium EP7]
MSPRLSILAAALLLIAGCGEPPAPPTSDQAKAALQSSLDAWKAGEKPASLATKDPKVEAIDFEWNAAKSLETFSIGSDSADQSSHTFPVSLTLKGEPAKDVKYMVLGYDPIRVFRDEDFTRSMNMEDSPVAVKKKRRR